MDNVCFSEKERGKVLKDYMETFMNEENDWDHNVEGYAVEGRDLIAASVGVGIQVMAEICQSLGLIWNAS